ncbi:ribosomal-protein-alanine acetyltransferase [Enterococcus moraviensis ATCC BAA-383]|uniref:[Ribosomal protein bS18]-alanine N-acetyltransferase n=1 Tax=Enterococcus moraviensis ATCC BAA-383 TaxID=1158609 RepID=R2QRH8_9ENTE|nr:ribosomal protein S18-alanine N-acetyltransferase [Enterococcus moraviensis]EOH99132.1 ribosomal-protein-alanine acetyltransferase [Enterococcus moraviensis ATCC BAA-383]EOT72185.1 ribosomal-protein-alanine acetyltransferase [Enterococcus moraviensis ATCC BAA-383]OJG67383.1 ribosomal-protein-alanine acetyltransferase [Enterococcus moraviensis]
MYYFKEELMPQYQLAEQIWNLSESAYKHGSPWTLTQFADDLAQKSSEYLVLIMEDQWVGFISFHLVLDEVEITHVAIQKAFQKQGYGSQLIDQMISYVLEQEVSQVFLEVRESNVQAKSLYEKKGFNTINRRKNYYNHPKEAGIVMCLNVKEVNQ